jgi:polyferredoxin
MTTAYRFLADVVLAIHFAYVAFVVLGLVAILLGIVLRWQWVRNFWFRAVHFFMIAIVVAESLWGVLCPLTEWENHLRELAGDASEPGSFIARWMDKILFVDLSHSALVVCYCVFGLVVLITLILAPPRWPNVRNRKRLV